MDYIIILIAAVFVNNIVLAQFLGICPFLGVSSKVSTSVGMSGAVLFVMTLATIVTYLLHEFVLVPAGLDYLRTITFILVIASLVQMVEIILKKVSDEHIEEADGIFDVRENKFIKRPKEFKFDVNLYLKDFQKQVDKDSKENAKEGNRRKNRNFSKIRSGFSQKSCYFVSNPCGRKIQAHHQRSVFCRRQFGHKRQGDGREAQFTQSMKQVGKDKPVNGG